MESVDQNYEDKIDLSEVLHDGQQISLFEDPQTDFQDEIEILDEKIKKMKIFQYKIGDQADD